MTEPFFDLTIEDCLQDPYCLLFRRQTPLDVLAHLDNASSGSEPTGFIFHMSRCGSTLVSQLLATLPGYSMLMMISPRMQVQVNVVMSCLTWTIIYAVAVGAVGWDLSTKIGSATARNQKSCTPPAIPSASPSKARPVSSTKLWKSEGRKSKRSS